MNTQEIGMRLRTARKNKGWTQEVLAEKADISASFLGHLEHGTRIASVKTWMALCAQLNVSIDSMLYTRGNQAQKGPCVDFMVLQYAQKAKTAIDELCSLLEKPSV